MAIGRTVHWIGVVFVTLAAILLLITCIGAPAVNDIGLLKVTLNNASDIRQSSVVYGPFGYCVLDVAPRQTDQDYCPKASIGYIPAQEMRLLDPGTTWSTWEGHDLDLMTVAFVLFPIALTFAFFAAAFAFCGVIGSVIAAVLCAWGWACTLVVLVVAFVSMGDLKRHVQAAGLKSHYGTGMWTALVAMILLFLAMLLLFFSCCSGLRRRHREKGSKNKGLHDKEYGAKSEKHHGRHHDEDYAPAAAVAAAPFAANGRHHRTLDPARSGTYESYHLDRTRNNDGYAPAAATVGAAALASREHRSPDARNGRDYETDPRSGRHHNADFVPAAVVGGAAAAPREHRLKDTMRDGRGLDGPVTGDTNRGLASQGRNIGAPAHALTTHSGRNPPSHLTNPAMLTHNMPSDHDLRNDPNTVTHHHPTTTTTTATHYDHDRDEYNTEMHTSQYDPINHTPRNSDGGSRFGSMRQSRYGEGQAM